MSGEIGDAQDGWRGSYDGWLSHDRRNDEPDVADHSPKTCSVCGNLILRYGPASCHTPQERDAAANAKRYRR